MVSPIYIGLLPEEKKQLKTPEDYAQKVVTAIGMREVGTWVAADVLLDYYDRFGGEQSLKEFAANLNIEYSTVGTWIRTARAFPLEKRIPTLSFTHHYRASFADSYDRSANEFEGDDRFSFLEQADAANWAVRDLQEEVDRFKRMRELDVEKLPCAFCKSNNGDINTYGFYARFSRREPQKRELHDACFDFILQYIDNYGQQN